MTISKDRDCESLVREKTPERNSGVVPRNSSYDRPTHAREFRRVADADGEETDRRGRPEPEGTI